MKNEDDISQEEIAKEEARDRILGVAIQHYLTEKRDDESIHCKICSAVQRFEAKLAHGQLKMLCEPYLQPE